MVLLNFNHHMMNKFSSLLSILTQVKPILIDSINLIKWQVAEIQVKLFHNPLYLIFFVSSLCICHSQLECLTLTVYQQGECQCLYPGIYYSPHALAAIGIICILKEVMWDKTLARDHRPYLKHTWGVDSSYQAVRHAPKGDDTLFIVHATVRLSDIRLYTFRANNLLIGSVQNVIETTLDQLSETKVGGVVLDSLLVDWFLIGTLKSNEDQGLILNILNCFLVFNFFGIHLSWHTDNIHILIIAMIHNQVKCSHKSI